MREPGKSTSHAPGARQESRPKRTALWLLVIPVLLYLLTPVVADRIHPIIFGMPFMVFYTIVVSIITPIVLWFAAHRDPLFRANAHEPVPADDIATISRNTAAPDNDLGERS